MTDLNPTVFQEQEQCACERQQTDIVSRMRDALKQLAGMTTEPINISLIIKTGDKDWFALRIGDEYNERDITVYDFDLEKAISEAKAKLEKRTSPEFARALALQKEADEILARLK